MKSSSLRLAFVLAACLPMASHADETPQPPPSRARAILRMQFESGVTQPAPPPITGDEAQRIYNAYISRMGGAAPGAASSSAGASVSNAAVTGGNANATSGLAAGTAR